MSCGFHSKSRKTLCFTRKKHKKGFCVNIVVNLFLSRLLQTASVVTKASYNFFGFFLNAGKYFTKEATRPT